MLEIRTTKTFCTGKDDKKESKTNTTMRAGIFNNCKLLIKKLSLALISEIPKTLLFRWLVRQEDAETTALYKHGTVLNSDGFLSISRPPQASGLLFAI